LASANGRVHRVWPFRGCDERDRGVDFEEMGLTMMVAVVLGLGQLSAGVWEIAGRA
jgi:hypothetical protein